tara:strand:+ start:677 stop:1267 length:591 start_codon:yes stop_codon:yes gene_type:complete
MRSVYNFVVTPDGNRYNNTQNIAGKDIIVNTEINNYQHINRKATVISTPIIGETDIKPGDTVIIHHNVFRRWHNVKGKEKNSRSYFNENTYLITQDQIFLYKRNNNWIAPKGYCFIQPIKDTNSFNTDIEKPLMGIVKYSDGTIEKDDLIGFYPGSEYEFVVDGIRMYRVLSNLITIKYEYQGNEETYNPSWTQSC